MIVVWYRLWRRGSGGKGRTGWRVVVGRVERGGYRGGVEHVLAEGVVVHQGGSDGGEAKVLLEGACGIDDGILGHLEGVDGEGGLGLRGWEGRWLHVVLVVVRVLVERVLVEVGFGLGVGWDHDAVDRRYLWGGFGAPLGGSSLVDAGLADVAVHVAKLILSVDSRRDRRCRGAGEGEVMVVGQIRLSYRYRWGDCIERSRILVGGQVWPWRQACRAANRRRKYKIVQVH